MMYKHYIRINEQSCVIDGYSTFERQPQEGDIYLHDGGEVFELLERQPGLSLYFIVAGTRIYQFAYDGKAVRWRTKEEINSDIPALPPVPDTGTRLDDAETDIATLIKAFNIITGGG